MAKNIKVRGKKGPPLPIKPTENPSPQEVMIVAQAALDIVQQSIRNPAAIITCLKAADEAYARNAELQGMDPEVVEECEVLGLKLASVMIQMQKAKSGGEKSEETSEEKSDIITPDTRLVGPDLQPIAPSGKPIETDGAVEEDDQP